MVTRAGRDRQAARREPANWVRSVKRPGRAPRFWNWVRSVPGRPWLWQLMSEELRNLVKSW